jgi:hypothetical protein
LKKWLGLAALLGILVFGLLVWRSVRVVRMDPTASENNFEEALGSLPSRIALVHRDARGRLVRPPPVDPVGARPTQVHILAYYVDGQRLVRTDLPLWFFKVKGPAAAYALRGTGFDLEMLGLTAGDLEQAGARVVLDERRATGDRLLAWTD